MHPLPCSFALLLLLLFADAHSENLIEQAILPVKQPFDNNNNTLTRSLTIKTEIIAAQYVYLMKLKVNTSGDYIETYATLDTGSDLIWLNPKDCRGNACHCSSNSSETKTSTTTDQPNCIKKPKQFITCEEKKCCGDLKGLNIKSTCPFSSCGSSEKKDCGYVLSYQDGLSNHGMLGTGKFSFPNINSKETDFVDSITFGVSEEVEGPFERKSVGVVGLGFGTLSLLKQLTINDRKFSYCLPNQSLPNLKSKIKFGNAVATSGSTLSLTKQGGPGTDCEDRYCVHLANITVHDPKHKINVSQHTNKVVMVIDSGSTFTYLVDGLFDVFFGKLKQLIGGPINKEVKPYHNCFEESAVNGKQLENVWFEFGGSGTTKIELKRKNFFDNPSYEGNKYFCLTVANGDEKKLNHHLLGNRAQMDFWVAFDLSTKEKKVSFDQREKCCDE